MGLQRVNKMNETKIDYTAIMASVATELGKLTGDNWTIDRGDSTDWNIYFNLVCNGKRRLWVKPSWDKPGMFTIFTTMEREENSPSNREYEYNKVRKEIATSINCSVSKLPEKIASDIVKRILPASLALVAASAIDREAEAKRIVYATSEMQKLVDAIGNVGELRKNISGNPIIELRLDDGYGDVYPQFYSEDNGSVEIKLRSISVDMATAVCKLLSQFKRSE